MIIKDKKQLADLLKENREGGVCLTYGGKVLFVFGAEYGDGYVAAFDDLDETEYADIDAIADIVMADGKKVKDLFGKIEGEAMVAD